MFLYCKSNGVLVEIFSIKTVMCRNSGGKRNNAIENFNTGVKQIVFFKKKTVNHSAVCANHSVVSTNHTMVFTNHTVVYRFHKDKNSFPTR